MPLAPIQNNSQSIGLEDLELEPRYEYQEKYTESQLDSLVAAILSKNPTIDKVQSIDKDIHYSERNKKRQGKCGLDQDGNLRNPLYLDANGVTIKARKCNRDMIGEKWELNGVEYTIVDNETLREMVEDWGRFVKKIDTIPDIYSLSGFRVSIYSVKEFKDYGKVVTTFVTNLNRLFASWRTVRCDITSWDTSNVTDMGYLFNANYRYEHGSYIGNQLGGAWSFNQDISHWDTSQVKYGLYV